MPPSPLLRILSTGLIFPFLCISTQYFHYIPPPTPFLISPHTHWCQPLSRTCFTLLSFILEKRYFFYLRWLYRSLVMAFPRYVYYIPNWFISSILGENWVCLLPRRFYLFLLGTEFLLIWDFVMLGFSVLIRVVRSSIFTYGDLEDVGLISVSLEISIPE
jgi:hypothetical protein